MKHYNFELNRATFVMLFAVSMLVATLFSSGPYLLNVFGIFTCSMFIQAIASLIERWFRR